MQKEREESELALRKTEAEALYTEAKEYNYPGVNINEAMPASFLNTFLASPEFLTKSVKDHAKASPQNFNHDPSFRQAVQESQYGDGAGNAEDPDAVFESFSLQNRNPSSHLGLGGDAEERLIAQTIQRLRKSRQPYEAVLREGEYHLLTQRPFVPKHHREAWQGFQSEAAQLHATRKIDNTTKSK